MFSFEVQVYCSVQLYVCLHVFRFCVAVNDVGNRSTCFRIILFVTWSLLCKDNVIFVKGINDATFHNSHSPLPILCISKPIISVGSCFSQMLQRKYVTCSSVRPELLAAQEKYNTV